MVNFLQNLETTFFASTEAALITPSTDGSPSSKTSQAANIGLMGALVVHSNAGLYNDLLLYDVP